MALRYRSIFWDLDGTLTDPREGIERSVRFALGRLGIAARDDAFGRMIGPPLARSLRELYGLHGDVLATALALYRERYSVVGWRENRPYPGIAPLLADLAAAGARMAVATLKPAAMARRILAQFSLDRYLETVYAPAPFDEDADKGAILADALSQSPWHGSGPAVMVGDHPGDVDAALRVGIDAVGVLYGYGNEATLRTSGATYLAAGPADLRTMLFR